MKKFKAVFKVEIVEGQNDSYGEPKALSFNISENVPVGTDPVRHLAKRLAEELKRNSNGLVLDWKDENTPEDSIDDEFNI